MTQSFDRRNNKVISALILSTKTMYTNFIFMKVTRFKFVKQLALMSVWARKSRVG